jgi:hypothetical protein
MRKRPIVEELFIFTKVASPILTIFLLLAVLEFELGPVLTRQALYHLSDTQALLVLVIF